MTYNKKIKDKVIKLRKKGRTYNEILEQVNVSKNTISRWCKDINLNKRQKDRIDRISQKGREKGRITAAKNKIHKRMIQTKEIYKEAERELGRLSKRDAFIAGITLYAGEGHKQDGRIGVANSSPKILIFMKWWLKEFCKIPEEKFKGAIWIHDNLSVKNAEKYWSKKINIPLERFHKTYIVPNKTKSKKKSRNIHKYGIFTIRVNDTRAHRKIMGWTEALFNDNIYR